jgi:hypothetical protein
MFSGALARSGRHSTGLRREHIPGMIRLIQHGTVIRFAKKSTSQVR